MTLKINSELILKRFPCIMVLLLAFSFHQSKAQDIHFSQFFNSPLSVSPSNTGNYEGDWRVMGNFRQQWKRIDNTPYLTQSIGFDKQFFIHSENFSAGALIINDKSAGSLKVLKTLLSAAYHKRINMHIFHAGLQAGYVSKRWSPDVETFPNQFNWDSGQFDATMANNEATATERLGYLDVNIGAGYSLQLKKIRPFVSMALYHVNYPKETFLGNKNNLKPRQVLNMGAAISVSQNLVVEPNILLMTAGKASELVLGGNVIYTLAPNAAKASGIYAGVFYRDGFSRNSDAYFMTTGLKFKNYLIGFSYDRNISPLQIATDKKGAIELSFIYTSLSTRLKKVEIPCDRY